MEFVSDITLSNINTRTFDSRASTASIADNTKLTNWPQIRAQIGATVAAEVAALPSGDYGATMGAFAGLPKEIFTLIMQELPTVSLIAMNRVNRWCRRWLLTQRRLWEGRVITVMPCCQIVKCPWLKYVGSIDHNDTPDAEGYLMEYLDGNLSKPITSQPACPYCRLKYCTCRKYRERTRAFHNSEESDDDSDDSDDDDTPKYVSADTPFDYYKRKTIMSGLPQNDDYLQTPIGTAYYQTAPDDEYFTTDNPYLDEIIHESDDIAPPTHYDYVVPNDEQFGLGNYGNFDEQLDEVVDNGEITLNDYLANIPIEDVDIEGQNLFEQMYSDK